MSDVVSPESDCEEVTFSEKSEWEEACKMKPSAVEVDGVGGNAVQEIVADVSKTLIKTRSSGTLASVATVVPLDISDVFGLISLVHK